MPTDSIVPLPTDRSYARRIDDATAAEVDAMLPGDSRYCEDMMIAACVTARMRYNGWRPIRRKDVSGGARVWRGEDRP